MSTLQDPLYPMPLPWAHVIPEWTPKLGTNCLGVASYDA